ncbi:MAG TPA: alpha/beta fold hydrolase [Vicinamibacterales bacterium]|nr:alpha/beta fold hydrolase [Vicinamibacterales bacterium]
MTTRLREIPGPVGRLEALLEEPPTNGGVNTHGLVERGRVNGIRAAVVLAHPHPQYGGTMHTKVVYQAAKAFTRIGCAVLRFNFRGVGTSEGAWDEGRGELDDFRAGIAFMRSRYPDHRLWSAGMSFGAWVALSAGEADDAVSTLVGIAPPLARYDFERVRTSSKPKFFIQGERDELCPLKDMQEFYARSHDPKELVVIDAADHLFDGKALEVGDAIEDLLGDWAE